MTIRVSHASLFFMVALLSAFRPAQPSSANDLKSKSRQILSGELITREWCGVCHAISPHVAGTNQTAPDLKAIAENPKTDRASLLRIMNARHIAMTTEGLHREEMEAVAKYILGLSSSK